MKPIIEVIISPAGEIIVDAVGFKGADCEQATRYLEQALGVVGQREKKPQYHRQQKASHEQRVGL
jgi:Protein of unknown function (DUF2997)